MITMVFTTHCWRNSLLSLALLLACLPVWAGGIKIQSAQSYGQDGHYFIDAKFEITLDEVHESALLAGVPLVFTSEFNLTRPRWYWAYRQLSDWFDSTSRQEIKLSYHSLTRSYRVSVGSLFQSFSTLSEALRVVGIVRDWKVFERGGLTRKGPFSDMRLGGELMMRLDTSKLPKPFQLSILGQDEWVVESPKRELLLEETSPE